MFRLPLVALVCAVSLAGCLPEAKFNATVRVLDEETGQPIPNALILVGALVNVEPPIENPRYGPMAAARGMTDASGTLHLRRVEGMYTGEKPQDPFYKMVEAYYEAKSPNPKRKVTGVKAGSILVLAPGYGATEQPFFVQGHAARERGWLGRHGQSWYKEAVGVEASDLSRALALTIHVAKPKSFDQAYGMLGFDAVIDTLDLTSVKTGTDPSEKDMVWKFFTDQMLFAVNASTEPYYMRQLMKFREPAARKEFNGLAATESQADLAIALWLAQKALEALPADESQLKANSEPTFRNSRTGFLGIIFRGFGLTASA